MTSNDSVGSGSEAQQSDTDRFLENLREHVRNSSPKGQDWCPTCEEYLPFEPLQVVERPEFGVRNVVKGCPTCKYSRINQTEWVEVDPAKSETVAHPKPELGKCEWCQETFFVSDLTLVKTLEGHKEYRCQDHRGGA